MVKLRKRKEVQIQPSRYEDAGPEEYVLMEQLREEFFPSIQTAKIKLLFDGQKKVIQGKLTLGRIKKTDALIRHLSREESQSFRGFDYIVVLDKKCWLEVASEEDRTRLLRHELRHARYNPDLGEPYTLWPHDIEDFKIEIELNRDDVGWADRLAGIVMELYAEEKENKE